MRPKTCLRKPVACHGEARALHRTSSALVSCRSRLLQRPGAWARSPFLRCRGRGCRASCRFPAHRFPSFEEHASSIRQRLAVRCGVSTRRKRNRHLRTRTSRSSSRILAVAGARALTIRWSRHQWLGRVSFGLVAARCNSGVVHSTISTPRMYCTSGMNNEQPNNPLHGITLERVLVRLVDHYGWEELGLRISINCFKSDPSVKSSLNFLRRTPWAREQVESLYVSTFARRVKSEVE